MAEDSLLSAEQKFALIEAVRGHPMLYDKKDDDYHNVERKNRVWANIAAKEGVQLESGKEAKESWDRLRTLFKRNHNKKAASGSGAAKTPKWQFYTAMEFLESHSEPRAESQSTLQLTAAPPSSGSSSNDEKPPDTEKKLKESVFRTPTTLKNRKRSSEQGMDEWFADAIKRLEEKASKPKSRNQNFGEMLANDLDDFPEHVQPALRNEIMQLVQTRRTQYCYSGSPAGGASPFSASSPASTSTVTNYVLEQQYNPSQLTMEPDVALDLARLTAFYVLWRKTYSSEQSPSTLLSGSAEKEMSTFDQPEENKVERKRIVPLEYSSDSDSDHDPGPLKKRPKRRAAVEAEERVRLINEFLRRERMLLSKRVVRAKTVDQRQSDGESDANNASQDFVPEDFEVEQVLDERWVGGTRQYLLKWQGDDTPTWEPASNVDNCDGLLAEFNEEVDPGAEEDDDVDSMPEVVDSASDAGFDEDTFSD